MEDEFRSVVGYEGLYEVNRGGVVKSLHARAKDCIRKQQYNRTGYRVVGLWKDGRVKNGLVHRLVAQAFIPNPSNLETVNHIDCDKTNNHISNLEWMSNGDNTRHMVANGLHMLAKRTHCKNGHPFTPDNMYKCKGVYQRICATCKRNSSNKRYALKKLNVLGNKEGK